MINCPNHGGSYDCTPFCELCTGNQEILASALVPAAVKDLTVTPREIVNLGIWLLEQEITGVNLAVVIDGLASDYLRHQAAAL